MNRGEKPTTIYRVVLISTFLFVLLCPGLFMLFVKGERYSLTEKRPLAEFPLSVMESGGFQQYFRRIDSYLNDHFGFREWLIYRYQREVRKRFGITGDETLVQSGTHDWYFGLMGGLLKDFLGKAGSAEVLQDWYVAHRAKVEFFAQKKTRYLLIVAPNKQSVYPEYRMGNWQEVHGESKLDQLIRQYPDVTDNAVVDLGSVLQKQKRDHELLYYKSDTHWTDYGAYIAFMHIFKRLQTIYPALSLKSPFAFTIPQTRECSPKGNTCGDLTSMLLDFSPFHERYRKYIPKKNRYRDFPLPLLLTGISDKPNTRSFMSKCESTENRLKIVVFRDSFFGALSPYFSETFGEVVYLYKSYDQNNVDDLLEKYKPDLVIEEIVERGLFFS